MNALMYHVPEQLTRCTNSITAIEVTTEEINISCKPSEGMETTYLKPVGTEKAWLIYIYMSNLNCDSPQNRTYGAINEISLLEPHPAQVGLTRVISTVEQCSPLSRQSPKKEKEWSVLHIMRRNYRNTQTSLQIPKHREQRMRR